MAGIWESIKRVVTGKVMQQHDLYIADGNTTVSFRAKRKGNSDEEYVVLAMTTPGNYQYFAFELNEFDQLIDAATRIRNGIRARAITQTTS